MFYNYLLGWVAAFILMLDHRMWLGLLPLIFSRVADKCRNQGTEVIVAVEKNCAHSSLVDAKDKADVFGLPLIRFHMRG